MYSLTLLSIFTLLSEVHFIIISIVYLHYINIFVQICIYIPSYTAQTPFRFNPLFRFYTFRGIFSPATISSLSFLLNIHSAVLLTNSASLLLPRFPTSPIQIALRRTAPPPSTASTCFFSGLCAVSSPGISSRQWKTHVETFSNIHNLTTSLPPISSTTL